MNNPVSLCTISSNHCILAFKLMFLKQPSHLWLISIMAPCYTSYQLSDEPVPKKQTSKQAMNSAAAIIYISYRKKPKMKLDI